MASSQGAAGPVWRCVHCSLELPGVSTPLKFCLSCGQPQVEETAPSIQETPKLEYEFVNPLTENQICSICMKVLCWPHLINCCEQQYCQECLERWLKTNKTCPHCRRTDFSHMLMRETSRKIGELKVYCPNKKHGCQTILKISECDNHLSKANDKGCLFVSLTCPNQCNLKVFRCDMKKHTTEHCPRRLQKCTHCAKEGEYQHISGDHVSQCPEYPVACPQKCGATVPRKDHTTHKDMCPKEIIPCMYHELGCTVKVLRENLTKHMESYSLQHTAEIAKSFLRQQKELETIKKELTTMREIHAAISKVLKEIPENLQVSQIQTLLCNTTEVKLGDSVYLTLSQSNKTAGQHFIKLAGMTFIFSWELNYLSTSYLFFRPAEAKYGVSLTVKVPGEITACDVEVSIYPYEGNHDEINNKLATVCCFNDGTVDKPFIKVLKATEIVIISKKDIENLEMKLQFLQHNSSQCQCDCHKRNCSRSGRYRSVKGMGKHRTMSGRHL